jgi:hypothetical protein
MFHSLEFLISKPRTNALESVHHHDHLRSLICLLFAVATLLGYLSLQLGMTYFAGPFFFLLPLPLVIIYFWHYCDVKFKKASMVSKATICTSTNIILNTKFSAHTSNRQHGSLKPSNLFFNHHYTRQPFRSTSIHLLLLFRIFPLVSRKSSTTAIWSAKQRVNASLMTPSARIYTASQR